MMMLINGTLKVRIPDCPGPERVMSVVAADPQMVVKVIQQIQIQIQIQIKVTQEIQIQINKTQTLVETEMQKAADVADISVLFFPRRC